MKRDIFDTVKAHILNEEITIISGSRQVGKTTLLKSLEADLNHEYQTDYFTLERFDIKKYLDENPLNLFSLIPDSSGTKRIVFIDEIQYLSNPTNFLKLLYDEYRQQVKLVVTGSSAFYIDKKFKDSLAGRKRIFHLSPFSFNEVLRYKGKNHLINYTEQGIGEIKNIPFLYQDELKKHAEEYLVYGGYPKVVVNNSYQEKQEVLNELVNAFLRKDALEADVIKETEFMLFVETLADRVGNKINRNQLSNVCGISDETVRNYLYILNKSFHISYARPFWKSKTSELRKMPKLYFQDNGLRNAVINDFSPVILRKDKGDLAENFAYNLLRKHFKKEHIQYWTTREQNEVDFILEKSFAVEVKYSGKTIKPSKYKLFRKTYPEIKLQFACMDNFENMLPLWAI